MPIIYIRKQRGECIVPIAKRLKFYTIKAQLSQQIVAIFFMQKNRKLKYFENFYKTGTKL